jgi:hypothetical protein
MINWNGCGSGRGLILRYYPGIVVESLRKITKNLSQDSRSPGRDLNPGPPEYESEVLAFVLMTRIFFAFLQIIIIRRSNQGE